MCPPPPLRLPGRVTEGVREDRARGCLSVLVAAGPGKAQLVF